jgi:hypothetical protein
MKRDKPKRKKERAEDVWGALAKENSVTGGSVCSEISEFKIDLERERSMDHPDHLSDLLAELAVKESLGVNVLNSREDLMEAGPFDNTPLENYDNSAIGKPNFVT